MKFLVFLEHHEGKLQKDSLGVLGKAASLGDAEAVLLGLEVEGLAADAGRFGAQRVHVMDDVLLDKPLPPRVDALETLVGEGGFDAVLFAASVLSADVAAGLAARLDAGLNYDLTDLAVDGGELVGTRPALGDSVVRGRRLELGAPARARPLGDVRATGERRGGGGREVRVAPPGFLARGDDGRAGARGERGDRRLRTPT